MPTIAGYEGTCLVKKVGDDTELLASDPRVTITAELVDMFRAGYGHPAVSLVGDVLTFRATNRTAVYRLGDYDRATGSYPAGWPD